MKNWRNECGVEQIDCMMEVVSADRSDLTSGVGVQPVIQVVMPTQTSKVMPAASTNGQFGHDVAEEAL